MQRYFIHTLVVAALMLVPGVGQAAQLEFGERASLAPNATTSEDVYMAAGMIETAGQVGGDLLTAGGNVFLDTTVSADVMTAGGNVTILGDIADDLRAFGGTVTVGGTVGGDVVVLSGQTTITGDGITGDVLWAGGTLTINAPVQGDVRIAGGEVFINAPVEGDVSFRGDKLTLGSGAAIAGNLSYAAREEAAIADGATVAGQTSFERIERSGPSEETIAAWLTAFATLAVLAGILMRLAGALVLGLAARPLAHDVLTSVMTRPFAAVGKGFVALVVIPAAAALLLVTIIGVPLGLLVLAGYAVLVIMSVLLGPVLLGSALHAWWRKPDAYRISWLTIIGGVVAFVVLTAIPIVGWVVEFLILLAAMGGLVTVHWHLLQEYWHRER